MRGSDDWERLFDGLEEAAANAGIPWAWLSGLTAHPSSDVRLRLARHVPSMALDPQPPEIVDAAVARTDWYLRRAWAQYQREMSLAQWERLLDTDRTGWQDTALRCWSHQNGPLPPAERFAAWAADPDPRVRLRALSFRGLPGHVAATLAADPDPRVRHALCAHAWDHLDTHHHAALRTDPDPTVRDAAAAWHDDERPLSTAEFDTLDDDEDRRDAVRERPLHPDLARRLTHHPDTELRRRLAEKPHLGPDLLATLAGDLDPDVRAEIAARPDTPEHLRAQASADQPPDQKYGDLRWVEDLHDDPTAMRRLARSASTAIRRSVARARTLPPDTLDLLAHDPDSGVRSTLAVHNDTPPADLLLEAATTWAHPDKALRRPGFPLHALTGDLADHTDPKIRRLALHAPDCTPATVERLATDPDPLVHTPAAADPRLSPATALRLLAATEPDPAGADERTAPPAAYGLRRAVIRNPRLPVATLVALLRDRATAEAAAGNPAIPAPVAHRLIDLAAAHR
ncbi:hypothetical protein ACFYST_15200 [Kitasatospora sp. NPDC004614]|uniref:hypothetical protein n=1 Tax=unclassified Kitasatospora TaxID=2633591 RepID=UPI0036CE9790